MKQNILGPIIKEFRKNRNLTQKDLGRLTGFSQNTISNHENGNRSIDEADIFKYAEALNVSPNAFFQVLIGKANEPQIKSESNSSIESIYNQLVPKRQQKVFEYAEKQLEEQNDKVVPLLGGVAANPAELAYGDIAAEEVVEYNVPEKADCALVVHGDSMEPDYHDGDIVFYKCQITIENGETAVIEINGDGVTLKKVYFNFDEDKVILRSLNDKYEDRELNPEEVRVLGKVVK